MIVSYYSSITLGKVEDIPFLNFLADIKAGRWNEQVLSVRALYPTPEYSQAKRKLPGITASGKFANGYSTTDENGQQKFCTGRTHKDLQEHSGIIYLDLDSKQNPAMDVAELRSRIQADSYTFACHLSISGQGLAVAFRIPPDNHNGSFRALASYYQQRFGVIVDSLPDPTRLRFVSYDPALYLNETAATFEKVLIEGKSQTPARVLSPKSVLPLPSHGNSLEEQLISIGRKMIESAAEGEKHHKVRGAGRTLGGYIASGFVDYQRAYDALWQTVLAKKQIVDLKGAQETLLYGLQKGQEQPLLPEMFQYKVRQQLRVDDQSSATVSKLAQQLSIQTKVPLFGIQKAIEAIAQEQLTEVPLLTFWELVPANAKRNLPPKVVLNFDRFGAWLGESGFYKLTTSPTRLVQVVHHVVHPVEISDLIEYVKRYLNTLPFEFDGIYLSQLREAIKRQHRSLFDLQSLLFLDPLPGEFLRDTATTMYAFFENCWVATTAAGRQAFSYESLPALIHASQIIPRPFYLIQDEEAKQINFHRFTQYLTGEDEQRLAKLQRALGYLLHGYKDVTNARCVIFMDKIGEVGKSSGGTGKGLLMQAISQFVEVAQLDGEAFDLRDPFRYEEVTDTARIVFFDEWRATRNPFPTLYSTLTGGLPINRKYQAKMTIPFKDAPKFVIATNEVVTGDDDSSIRRKVEIALFKRYSAIFTPKDDFGTGFFGDYWDLIEYNRFSNLALLWVQDYLSNGLLLLKDESIAARGLAQDVGIQFHEFAVELLTQAEIDVSEGKEIILWITDTFDAYQQQSGDKRLSSQAFSKKMVQVGFVKVKNAARIYGPSRRHQLYFTLPKEGP
jgi:hypothetical protein